MRVQLQQAYCIHGRAYRETSQIVEMLTPDYGLIPCVRRGSRKKNASLGFLFAPLLISWSGKGELFTLTHVETTGAAQITSPALYVVGMYLNELIFRLVPKTSSCKEIFNLYQRVISLLDAGGEGQEKLLRLFEIKLLALLGHGLSLNSEMDSQTPIEAHCTYRYDVGLGAVKVTYKSNAWNVVKGATLLGMQSPLSIDSTCLVEAKRLVRGIIDWHLSHRSLRSREILKFIRT